jgi:hypothetical protein
MYVYVYMCIYTRLLTTSLLRKLILHIDTTTERYLILYICPNYIRPGTSMNISPGSNAATNWE